MDHALLDLCVRIYGLDACGKPVRPSTRVIRISAAPRWILSVIRLTVLSEISIS